MNQFSNHPTLPTPEELEQGKAEALDLFRRQRQLQWQMSTATDTERRDILHNIQNQLSALQHQYRDYTLQFKALLLAYESVRLAWYAIGQVDDGGKLERVAAAFDHLKRHLLKEE